LIEANQLKLYSISAAAKALGLGKDTVYGFVANRKIEFIKIGKRKKITYQELVRPHLRRNGKVVWGR
jgi:excisionase family DNA binding protein